MYSFPLPWVGGVQRYWQHMNGSPDGRMNGVQFPQNKKNSVFFFFFFGGGGGGMFSV